MAWCGSPATAARPGRSSPGRRIAPRCVRETSSGSRADRRRWARSWRRAASRRMTSCGAGRSTISEGFWASIWDEYSLGPRSGPVLARDEMPGAVWFPEARLNYAEYLLGMARPGETAIVSASESAPLSLDDLGRAARPGGALRGRAAAPRRRARRPRGRLHAERARDGGGVPRLREHRRDLVELRAGVRHADRGRPLQADRAEGADRDRGLPLRRARLRPPAARAGDRGGDPVARAHRAGAVGLGRRSCASRPS